MEFSRGEIIERGFCPKHMDKNGPINRHCIYVFFKVLIVLVFEIKMDKVRVYRRAKVTHVTLKNRKTERSSLEVRYTERVASEFEDRYVKEPMEKREIVLPSENVDELWMCSDGDGSCRKHKKKKRHEREENILSEPYYIGDYQDENVLQSGNTGELQVFSDGDGIHKKPKKKKRHEMEESAVSELRNVEDNQDGGVLQSGNIDELQVSADRDNISKKYKKKKRSEKEQNILLESYGTDRNKIESALQGMEDFEKTGAGGLCTVKKLSSDRQGEVEAKETYKKFLAEADDVTDLPFHIIQV